MQAAPWYVVYFDNAGVIDEGLSVLSTWTSDVTTVPQDDGEWTKGAYIPILTSIQSIPFLPCGWGSRMMCLLSECNRRDQTDK